MSARAPLLRLIPPQKVADTDQVAPLQYRIGDTARLLGYSRRTVERLIRRGELTTVGQGRLKRVPYDAIAGYLNRSSHHNRKPARCALVPALPWRRKRPQGLCLVRRHR